MTYEQKTKDFLTETNSTLVIEVKEFGRMSWDKDTDPARLIFNFTLSRGDRHYSGEFGSSLRHTESALRKFAKSNGFIPNFTFSYPARVLLDADILKRILRFNSLKEWGNYLPTEYDILSCLTLYCGETFEQFCNEFGYDVDSIKAFETYERVKFEVDSLQRLYSDIELEKLSELG